MRSWYTRYRNSHDTAYIGELYVRYTHLVYGVCLKYLHHDADAQDAVMQIFEKLIKELKKHHIEAFKPWLYTVVRNHCMMHFRKEAGTAKKEALIKDNAKGSVENPDTDHLDSDDERQTMVLYLSTGIESLRQEQRTCVEMFYPARYELPADSQGDRLHPERSLSDAERGEMDRLLHDDPFAQDALEGLRGVKHPARYTQSSPLSIPKLREKTGLRERRKKGIELHWAIYAYATVVIAVLIGLGFVMVHIFSGGPRDEAGHKLKAQESIPVMEPRKWPALPDTTKSAAPTDSTGSKPQETTPANQNGNATLTDAKPTSLPQTAATSPAPVSATPSPQPQAVGP
ncbi:unnamed protein product [Sphagnum jensenii]|uniref:RNA polymerase sigma-70 region 2 domain-containing protein n=2 Tax=Sphagnum jensenii TaxID=128206 RepID=A0ABP1A2U3_9BRYO